MLPIQDVILATIIVFVLGISVLFCLALVKAASRPMPEISDQAGYLPASISGNTDSIGTERDETMVVPANMIEATTH